MAIEPDTESGELHELRARLDRLERERAEEIARANDALAAAQDRSYWLERWGVDLNALMRRRGAAELRAALRGARSVYRTLYDLRSRAKEHAPNVPRRLGAVRRTVLEERAGAKEPAATTERLSRTISPDPLDSAPVSDLLHERLTSEDLDAVKASLTAAEEATWEVADPTERKRLVLAFAAHHGVQPALERTGLSAAMPPAGVHAMAQGPLAAGGSYYYADLVADALSRGGLELEDGQTVLDFGCSSGRVVRVLAAAHPDVEWHGCDPIPDAVDWAREHLPGISFERSPEYPPLPYDDGQFDSVFAISIWSHFAEGAALAWLKEMQRIVRPGGRLLITTHGEHTVAHTGRTGQRSAEQLEDVRNALFERGFWYAAEFGEVGDHGVANPDWGTAFLTPEWLLARITPDWRVALYRPGRVEDNQDLYVLERS